MFDLTLPDGSMEMAMASLLVLGPYPIRTLLTLHPLFQVWMCRVSIPAPWCVWTSYIPFGTCVKARGERDE